MADIPLFVHSYSLYIRFMAKGNNSIGALWTDMSQRSEIPTSAERAAMAAERCAGLTPVRHAVLMRYERLFDTWRVTLSIGNKTLRECRFEHDHTLEEMIRRGRGFTCLADRQAVELGMSHGRGVVILQLDAEQLAALESPR